MEELSRALRDIIDREGLPYLDAHPYDIYKELLQRQSANPSDARLVLVTLLAGVQHQTGLDAAALSRWICRECRLSQDAAQELGQMYAALFCRENLAAWDTRREEGFRAFCAGEWSFSLHAYAEWHQDGVYVEASWDGEADVKVEDPAAVRRAAGALLEQNPFTTQETLFRFFQKKLQAMVEGDFREYVTEDDYYPPVAEDYGDNFVYLADQFCEDNGFALVDWDGTGDTSDYIPE